MNEALKRIGDQKGWSDEETLEAFSEFIKEIPIEWQVFNLFDHKDKSNKLSTTGLTILRKDD